METFQPCRPKPSGYDTRICKRTGPRRQVPETHLEWYVLVTFALCVPQVSFSRHNFSRLGRHGGRGLGTYHIYILMVWHTVFGKLAIPARSLHGMGCQAGVSPVLGLERAERGPRS